MEKISFDRQLLKGIKNMHELGRQRAFELGNPYYCKEAGDDTHYTKELPTGERYLVDIEIIYDAKGYAIEVRDTLLSTK